MKKSYLELLFMLTLLLSCKKNEAADQLKPIENQTIENHSIPNQNSLNEKISKLPNTNLALSEQHFDFGKIKKGEKVQHTYEVTNTGDKPLVISSVVPGCGCTASDFSKEPILPSKKGKISLSFDSSNFDGLVNKQAEVYANVEKKPIIITFSADIQP